MQTTKYLTIAKYCQNTDIYSMEMNAQTFLWKWFKNAIKMKQLYIP